MAVEIKDGEHSAVFFCGWGDAYSSLYTKYFSSLTCLGPSKHQYIVKDQKISDFKIGTHASGQDMIARIKYYSINGHVVGFWYPISNYFHFDTAKNSLEEAFPGALYTNDASIERVLSRVNNKTSAIADNIGFVDCGNEFAVQIAVNDIRGMYWNKIGPYGDKHDGCLPGYYTTLEDNATTISVTPHVFCGKKYILAYISGISGNLELAKKALEQAYPNVMHYDLTPTNFEKFLECAVKM